MNVTESKNETLTRLHSIAKRMRAELAEDPRFMCENRRYVLAEELSYLEEEIQDLERQS